MEIIWIYGGSGSGKETFIKHIIQNSPKKLIKKLGWKDKKIIAIPESLKYVANYDGDQIIKKRNIIITIVESVKKILDKPTVILIKGQDSDLEFGLLNKLKKKIPKTRHQIIFLNTNLKILYKRCKKKSWWKKDFTIGTLKEWLNYQLQQLSNLNGFKIIGLDSSNMDYETIKFPPKLK